MINNLIRKLTNNIGLKILSLLVAVALWLVVVNYDDPVITNTYSDIQVEILNSEALTNQGKVYEVLNDSNVVDVTVSGKRSVIDSLNKENIKATADMTQMTDVNTLTISFMTNKNYNQLESIAGDHNVVQLDIENRVEKHLPIEVEVTGEPAEGYIIGDQTTNQNTVRVSGPESVVDTITSAKCSVSVAGRSSDISSSADINLYTADGKIVEHDNLTTNISSINVTVGILATKAVNIVYSLSGEPEEGYAVDGEPEADRKAVEVAGRSAMIDSVRSIVIPPEELDINGKSENYVAKIDLNQYLPNGVRLVTDEANGFDGKVNVTVNIVPIVKKEFDVPMENLQVINVPDGYEAEILLESNGNEDKQDNKKVTLKVETKGIEHFYEGVEGSSLTGVIDIQDYLSAAGQTSPTEGVYKMKILFAMPEGISETQIHYADIKISKADTGDTE